MFCCFAAANLPSAIMEMHSKEVKIILAWDCQQSLCSKDLFASPVLGMGCMDSLRWREKLEGWCRTRRVPAQLWLRVVLHQPRCAWSSSCSKIQISWRKNRGSCSSSPLSYIVLSRHTLNLLFHSCSGRPQCVPWSWSLWRSWVWNTDTAEDSAVSLNGSESSWGRRSSELPLLRDVVDSLSELLQPHRSSAQTSSSAGNPAVLEDKHGLTS